MPPNEDNCKNVNFSQPKKAIVMEFYTLPIKIYSICGTNFYKNPCIHVMTGACVFQNHTFFLGHPLAEIAHTKSRILQKIVTQGNKV